MSSWNKVTVPHFLLKLLDRHLNLRHLIHESMSRFISAQLNVGSLVPVGQPGLGNLVGSVLLPDGVLQVPDGRLHLGNFINCLLQICLQFPFDKKVVQ